MTNKDRLDYSWIRMRLFVPVFLFGVILPLVALGIELKTGMSAEIYYNPVATIFHTLLIAAVAISNAIVAIMLKSRSLEQLTFLRVVNSVSIGVGIYFAAIYLPLFPFAVIGIVFFGIGLLPLAPMFSLIFAAVLGLRIRKVSGYYQRPIGIAVWPFLVLGLLSVVAVEAPQWITQSGLRMAASENSQERQRGVQLIRKLGDDRLLLRRCYQAQPTLFSDIFFKMGGDSVPRQRAQEVYYRVTGIPYNARKPPTLSGWAGGARVRASEWDFDQGGDAVASRVHGLSLSQSRMDTAVDARSATVYTEWTLVFKNDSSAQQEARAEIALPPGAVASRLTLWIDGQEREAAYNERSRVKAAYKRVVQRRRDPVLANTSGPDRILLQCFPVPPNGGTMKTKIGITAPMALDQTTSGLLSLPYFTEHNFSIPDDAASTIWLEGDRAMMPVKENEQVGAQISEEGRHRLTGTLEKPWFTQPFPIRVSRDATWTSLWAESRGTTVQAELTSVSHVNHRKIVLVLDGSRRMKPHLDRVAGILEHFGDQHEVGIILAGDRVREMLPLTTINAESRKLVAKAIHSAPFTGGCDNVPALIEAWDLAQAQQAGAILWLHATQPYELEATEQLRQRFERVPDGPILYDFQFGAGPNFVLKALDGIPAVRSVPQFGMPEEDLKRLLNQWSDSGAGFRFHLTKADVVEGLSNEEEGSSHLVRLWASQEVDDMLLSGGTVNHKKAVELAMDHRLITPVTGAVVLESAQQYDEAGLKPVEKDTVPSVVPEPETFFYILVGLVMFLVAKRKRKKA